MKKSIPLFLALAIVSACSPRSQMDIFIDDLMSGMTLEQKIGQLNLVHVPGQEVTGPEVVGNVAELLKNDQLGAVLNIFGPENTRGLQKFAVDSSSTHIPLLFGMDVIHGYRTQFPIPVALACTWTPEYAERSARISAEEATTQGISWTYNPMVDIAHDARWGRIMEGAGEDPYLGADFARAYVRGYQGDRSGKPDQMIACVKHYALYGASDGGLDYTAADMSRSRMFNYYMEPYRAAVEEGVASIMTCFNEVDGVPGAANEFLLQDVLRDMWGFKGFVCADYDAVGELEGHGLGTSQEVTARSLKAGMDMDMCSGYFVKYLPELVKEGKVSEKYIDEACRRILEAKYKLGLFEDPYRFCRKEEGDRILCCPESRALSRKIAGESIVLLKNDTLPSGKALLPLAKNSNIALIGPFAEEVKNVIGGWKCNGNESSPVSLIQGIKNVSACKVKTAMGSNIMYDRQLQLLLTNYHALQMVPDSRTDSQMLSEALAVAAGADVIVAALGEAADMSGEGATRTDLQLPDAQKDLLYKLVATGKPVVLVVFCGRPLDLSWENENVKSILYAWFPGSEAGNAVADILFGDVNPSAHLTTSFPRCVGQLPYYYNHTPSARPYLGKTKKYISTYEECPPTPLYPFGYGLSYTHFEYGEPRASVNGRDVKVEFEVTNTGKVAGKEVAQLYVRDLIASQARPVCELKGYSKIELEAGETKTVVLTLGQRDFSFYNNVPQLVFEPGEFEIMVGGNCQDTKKTTVTVQ